MITQNIHHVTKVQLSPVTHHNGSLWRTIFVTTEDGMRVEITLHPDDGDVSGNVNNFILPDDLKGGDA